MSARTARAADFVTHDGDTLFYRHGDRAAADRLAIRDRHGPPAGRGGQADYACAARRVRARFTSYIA
ncbi:hypothetical protein WS79_19740 [Burkholderia territorii]|nr:hypothetical protein WS79_19740 [Burkholderia territorii]